MASLSDELILCTRNRPADVERCLQSLRQCDRLPSAVLVVDASDDGQTEQVIDELRRALTSSVQLRYVRAQPGLPQQRNLGVARSNADIVHFLDDDTVVEPAYFSELMYAFETRPELGGACGLVTNIVRNRPPLLTRLFYLDSLRPGAVLPSGRNTLALNISAPIPVDWLSGCSMSYRREVFNTFSFDEDLAGYALGEDVEFSYRVRQRYPLAAVPTARLAHLESPTERWHRRRIVLVELAHRHVRVVTRVGRLRPSAFWVSVIGQILYRATRLARHPSRQEANDLRWTVLASLRVLRDRPDTYSAIRDWT